MRINSVTWSIVSGTCDKKLVVIFRNDGIRKNAGNVAKNGFGQLGSAGGHKNMARAEIALSDLNDLIDYKDDKKLLRWIIGQTEKKSKREVGATAPQNAKQQIRNNRNHFRFWHLRAVVDAKLMFAVDDDRELKPAI